MSEIGESRSLEMKRVQRMWVVIPGAVLGAAMVLLPHAAVAQSSNPLQELKDAWKKARQPKAQKPEEHGSDAKPAKGAGNDTAQSGGTISTDDLNKDEPAANVVIDPKVMPEIVGVHLGMTLRDAYAALQQAYPKTKLTVNSLQMPTIPERVAYSVTTYQDSSSGDITTLGVVLPPNKQIVWAMARQTGWTPGQTPMNRGTVLAALRQKYGKESASVMSSGARVSSDRDIYGIYWLFNEQGKRIAPPDPGFPETTGTCNGGAGYGDGAVNAPGQSGYENPIISANKAWCKSVYVAVHAQFQADPRDPDNLIDRLFMDEVDMPLAVRAQKATVEWYRAIGEREHQKEIEKSKQEAPRL